MATILQKEPAPVTAQMAWDEAWRSMSAAVDLWRKHRVVCDAARAHYGAHSKEHNELEQANDELCGVMVCRQHDVLDLPAPTIHALLQKMELTRDYYEGSILDDDMMLSLEDDVRRLAGEAA